MNGDGKKENDRLFFAFSLVVLGVVPECLTDRIQALWIEQLETLAKDLLDFQGLEDLSNWFKSIESLG